MPWPLLTPPLLLPIISSHSPAPATHWEMCRVFSYLEKTEQSARDFKKFLELAPPEHRARPDALYALALDAAMQRDLAAARQLFAQVSER